MKCDIGINTVEQREKEKEWAVHPRTHLGVLH